MERNISDLQSTKFDLAIIGGGITGAFLALDAALRGMSVALVEKGDFGAATSSASSKLLHGGIRYLQQGKFHKVRESAFERAYFQSLAPHLTRYVPFIIPTYKGILKGKALLTSGMMTYEALCLGQNGSIKATGKKVPGWRFVSSDEIRNFVPGLQADGITGGVLFHESHMYSSERMTLAVLDTAARHGAVLANQMRAESFLVEGKRISGIRARDLWGGTEIEVRASTVINAAGPWIPLLNSGAGQGHVTGVVTGFSKGAHIVTRSLTNGHALALPTRKKNQGAINRGGRHVFIIPWRDHSLIGTTYGPYKGNLDEVGPQESDVKDLVEDINSALGDEILKRGDVRYAFAGLYPLIEDHINPNIYQGTGKYQVVDHQQKDGLEGLVSVFGAKFITARRLAEKALDVIVRKSSNSYRKCQTRKISLAAGEISDPEAYRRDKTVQYASLVPAEVVGHLITNYGTGIDRLLAMVQKNPKLKECLSPQHGVLAAEVIHAVEFEMALHLEDVIFRRTGLGTLGNPGEVVLSRCADLMSDVLGWGQEAREIELRRTMERFLV